MRRRRTCAARLVALGLATVAATAVCAQQNVARGRPYTCSVEIMDGWTGLVDGVTDKDTGPGCFATGNGNSFPKSVTIDLQRPCKISRVAVHNSSNGNTRGIVISCSRDGMRYEQLREFIFPEAQPITLNHRFNDRSAQFVRVVFTNTWGGGLGGDNTIFIREVEVFGSPTGEAPSVQPMSQPIGDPLIETRAIRLFRNWAIDDDSALEMAVLGDSFAACSENAWPQIVAERLEIARPDDAEVNLTSMTEDGLAPDPTSGHLSLMSEAEPDLVLVTFGTDLQRWDRTSFRAGMTGVLQRLLEETDALVVIVGPAVGDRDRLDIGRRVLDECEKLADVLGLPLVRTEAALLREGITADELRSEDGELTEETRRVVATSILELLLQP